MSSNDPWEADIWEYRTPAGNPVTFRLRPHTSDWNTANAITAVGNEYAMPSGLTGWGLDVGAHLGAATVTFLLDNPGARCIAIEALPENVALIEENVRLNHVESRAYVFGGAASNVEGTTWIGYGEVRDPTGIHQYIGNMNAPEGSSGVDADNVTLRGLLAVLDIDEIAWAKLDCEGCEYQFLDSPEIARIRRIVGEVHYGAERLKEIVSGTHDIQADKDFGPFWAIRRGLDWNGSQVAADEVRSSDPSDPVREAD